MARKSGKPSKSTHHLEAAPLVAGSAEASEIVDYKLRVRKDLRQRIERAADANRVSHNREMVNRLAQSFDYEATRSLEQIAIDMDGVWARYGKVFHDLSTRGDLIRATETLVEAVEQLPVATRGPIKEVVERVKAAINVINIEATAGMRRFRTT